MDTKRLNLFQYLSTAWWVLQGILQALPKLDLLTY